jgi:hypothetical protein
MSEMVLVVPLLVVVLALLTYFGRGMVRVQHASVMDRYELWRQIGGASDGGNPWGPHAANNDYEQLNQTFFGGNASTIAAGDNAPAFPDDAQQEMIERAGAYSPDGQNMLRRLFDNLPGGGSISLSTTHDNRVKLFEPFEGPINHAHTRIGNDWRFVNGQARQTDESWVPSDPRVTHNLLVVSEFFSEFDQQMESMGQAGNRYASMLRGLYRAQPGYAGPDVP